MAPLVFAAISKTAWYVAGGLFAVYAVVLAYIGLNRPNFPFNDRGERAVIAVSAALAVIAVAAAILSG